MWKTGLNWFGPVFGGFWRFRSGFFCISKLGNRLRLRSTQKRQKNQTRPDLFSLISYGFPLSQFQKPQKTSQIGLVINQTNTTTDTPTFYLEFAKKIKQIKKSSKSTENWVRYHQNGTKLHICWLLKMHYLVLMISHSILSQFAWFFFANLRQ